MENGKHTTQIKRGWLFMNNWTVQGQGTIKWSVKTTYTKDNVKKAIIKYIIRNGSTSLMFTQFTEETEEPMINGSQVSFEGKLREMYYNNESKGLEVILDRLEFVTMEEMK
jgi:hypothetical protein